MGINLFKKKPKFQRVVVYAKIIETSNYYITQDFWANQIKIVERRRYRRMQTVEKAKVEEAKKELKEYRESILYIKEQQEDIEELRGILEKTTTRLSLTKTDNNSMSTDKFSDGIDRISRIEKEKDEKLVELLTKKFVVDEKIDKLEFPFRDVLFMRYSRGKSWRYITQKLGFDDDRRSYQIHGEALQKYAEL